VLRRDGCGLRRNRLLAGKYHNGGQTQGYNAKSNGAALRRLACRELCVWVSYVHIPRASTRLLGRWS
jgi:hypothetical protein